MTTYLREEDVTEKKDGGIIKKVIREGEGECPKPGQKVFGKHLRRKLHFWFFDFSSDFSDWLFVCFSKVHYVGTLTDNTKFDSSRDRDQPFDFTLGKGQVIRSWDLGLATMRRGELALLVARAEYAYGAAGSPPKIPPNATLHFEVELLDFEDVEKQSWEMTSEEKLAQGAKYKEQGNDAFKAGHFEKAVTKYEKAINIFESGKGVDSEDDILEEVDNGGAELSAEKQQSRKQKQAEQIAALKQNAILCHLNAAAANLKLKKFTKAIENCTKALQGDSKNIKALYRRAQAHTEEADFQLAKFDLDRILEVDPNNKDAKAWAAEVAKRQAAFDKKQKKAYANLFEKLGAGDDNNSSSSENKQ